MRIGSTKPANHGTESSSSPTVGKSTTSAPRCNTLTIPTIGDQNHPTSGTSHPTVPKYARMDFPTFEGADDPLIWAHCCKQVFENQHITKAEEFRVVGFHM